LKDCICEPVTDGSTDHFARNKLTINSKLIVHVGKDFPDKSRVFVEALKEVKLEDPKETPRPVEGAKEKVRRKKKEEYGNFRASLFTLVLGQCSSALVNKLELREEYVNIPRDGIALLTLI
jgi:hypothetical protein